MIYYENHWFGSEDFSMLQLSTHGVMDHFHRCFELIYVTESKLYINVDNSPVTVNKGEFFLILPNQVHSYEKRGDGVGIGCVFAPEFVPAYYEKIKNSVQEEMKGITIDDKITAFICENLPNSQDVFMRKAVLYALCSEFNTQVSYQERVKNSDNFLAHKIITVVQERFTTEISLKDISRELGYSYQYLSRFFNKQFNIPFCQFVNQYRINYGVYLLSNEDLTISAIALKIGYDSIRSFNRNFLRIMKMTPKEHRTMNNQ